jgi:YidC/Oxa1 family membrane protein insertase
MEVVKGCQNYFGIINMRNPRILGGASRKYTTIFEASRIAPSVLARGQYIQMHKRSFWWSSPSPIAKALALKQKTDSSTLSEFVAEEVKAVEPIVLSESQPVVTELTAIEPSQTISAIQNIGDMKELGVGLCGDYSFTGIAEQMLEAIYVSSGLPWWSTIVVCTVALKLIMFPFVVKQQRAGTMTLTLAVKLQNIAPELKVIQEKIAQLKAQKASQNLVTEQGMKMAELMRTNKVSPLGVAWGFVPLPFTIGMFLALRSMAEANVPGMATDGLLWFTDLTALDSTWLLPVITCVGTLANIELSQRDVVKTAQSEMNILLIRAVRFVLANVV